MYLNIFFQTYELNNVADVFVPFIYSFLTLINIQTPQPPNNNGDVIKECNVNNYSNAYIHFCYTENNTGKKANFNSDQLFLHNIIQQAELLKAEQVDLINEEVKSYLPIPSSQRLSF